MAEGVDGHSSMKHGASSRTMVELILKRQRAPDAIGVEDVGGGGVALGALGHFVSVGGEDRGNVVRFCTIW